MTVSGVVSAVSGVARAVAAEVVWWPSRLARLVRVALVPSGVWLLATAAAIWNQAEAWLSVLIAAPVALGAWARLAPASYAARVSGPWWRAGRRRWVRRCWPVLMESCGLARRVPASTGGEPGVVVPRLARLAWSGGSQLVATPVLLTGQTMDDVQAAGDRLRVAVGAHRLRVLPDPALTSCRVVWRFGDPLAAPFDATLPDPGRVRLDRVCLGLTEDGDPWELDVRVSTLAAGSSGSGKWGLVVGLAPAVKAGLVQLWGVDLKGGMELAMGRALFTRYATTPADAVALLEDAATALQRRARLLAGLVRTHHPTTADPLVVVVVDELAALVAYQTDRDLLRRAEAALGVVLSQGRAPGFYVVAFVQDPRKETVKMRHLFPQSLGLRLKDREEVAMVLGDGAVAAGADCHRIPRSTPGVGFVVGEDGRPLRVRAGYVPDRLIRAAAARFPAPHPAPGPTPSSDLPPGRPTSPGPRTRSARASTSTRGR